MDELRKIRKILGWSQKELADKLGVSKQHLWQLECGGAYIRKKHVTSLEHALETEVYGQARMFDPEYQDVKALLAELQLTAMRNRTNYQKKRLFDEAG